MALETEGIHLDMDVLTRGVRAVLAGRQAGAYRVLEKDGQIAAQLMLTYEWSDWRAATVWWIQSVYVWPDFRRQGLYRRLYRSVEAEAREAGAAGLRLYVEVENARAQATYRALEMNGERYTVFEAMFGEH